MSSSDVPGADPNGLGQASGDVGEQVHNQLVEALILLLIEKGVLTKNDALSIVQTVAQVQRGTAEGGNGSEQNHAALQMLHRLYRSFDALADRPPVALGHGDNILQLRPPIYDGRPDFPRED